MSRKQFGSRQRNATAGEGRLGWRVKALALRGGTQRPWTEGCGLPAAWATPCAFYPLPPGRRDRHWLKTDGEPSVHKNPLKGGACIVAYFFVTRWEPGHEGSVIQCISSFLRLARSFPGCMCH